MPDGDTAAACPCRVQPSLHPGERIMDQDKRAHARAADGPSSVGIGLMLVFSALFLAAALTGCSGGYRSDIGPGTNAGKANIPAGTLGAPLTDESQAAGNGGFAP